MYTNSDTVRATLDRLNYEDQIRAEAAMIAALAILPASDDDESDPAEWPAWTDEECWEPGPESPEPTSSVWAAWLSRAPLTD